LSSSWAAAGACRGLQRGCIQELHPHAAVIAVLSSPTGSEQTNYLQAGGPIRLFVEEKRLGLLEVK